MRTRVFQSGNSQAVRIPADMRFKGDEVEIVMRDGERVLREIAPDGLAEAFEILANLPFDTVREDAPPQEREGL